MNNQSPLIPQGSLLEQKNQGRARVKIAVFFVLAVHGVGLMALLMQGCQKEKAPPETDLTATNPPSSMEATNLGAADTNPPPVAATNPPVAPVAPGEPVAPPAVATEYTVVQGDTLGAIAKNNHISLKALTDANPGVEPTKLKIGQKLHIPAPATATATTSPMSAAPVDSTGGEQVYTVKSGDVLYNIAKAHGTTVKAIRTANDLKSDRIVVGQKLKIPAKTAGTPAAPAEPASTPGAAGTPPGH